MTMIIIGYRIRSFEEDFNNYITKTHTCTVTYCSYYARIFSLQRPTGYEGGNTFISTVEFSFVTGKPSVNDLKAIREAFLTQISLMRNSG